MKGNYDDVNRLCSEVAEALPWAFVNVNMRPFYAEGSKSLGFEVAEGRPQGQPGRQQDRPAQFGRLWSLDPSQCEDVVRELIALGDLSEDDEGRIGGRCDVM